MPPIAFLLMVAAFGIFLALLFNRTSHHLVSTMLAHFSFNMSLAVGGAILGSVFIWTLAFIFLIVAIFGLAKLSPAVAMCLLRPRPSLRPFGLW
jgi:hypothetical protein